MQSPLTSRSLFLILFNRRNNNLSIFFSDHTGVNIGFDAVYQRGAKAEWGAEWNLFKWDAQIKKRRWGRVRDGGEQKWWSKRSRAEQMVRSCFRHHRLDTNNNHNHNNELMVYQTSSKRGDEPRQSVAQFVVIALVDLLLRLYFIE